MNWNISLTGGRENNSDSLSSGDRTGKSLNQFCSGKTGVVGPQYSNWSEVEQSGKSVRRGWKARTRNEISDSGILSKAGHVKSCLNLPGPSGKAKYYWETDSELVPWGKGEKHPEQGSEIVPETVRLQAVGAP